MASWRAEKLLIAAGIQTPVTLSSSPQPSTILTELPRFHLGVYSRRISVATRSDAVRRVLQRVAPQVLEGLTDSFTFPAVARDCSQCDHPTDEPVQCHLQQEHAMQYRGTLRRLPLLWPFHRVIDTPVRSQVSSCEIYGGQCGIGEGSSPSTLVSPCQRLATNDPTHSFINTTT